MRGTGSSHVKCCFNTGERREGIIGEDIAKNPGQLTLSHTLHPYTTLPPEFWGDQACKGAEGHEQIAQVSVLTLKGIRT